MRIGRTLALGVASLAAGLALNAVPRVWQSQVLHLGWPRVSVDAIPALTRIATVGDIPYKEQLGAMEDAWNHPSGVAGPNFAPYVCDARWRWLRFPNGHVILFQPWHVVGDALVGVSVVVLLAGLHWAYKQHRRRALPHVACSSCGYNLAGNVSGVCPECGTEVPGRRA